jgi:hypothetical protein
MMTKIFVEHEFVFYNVKIATLDGICQVHHQAHLLSSAHKFIIGTNQNLLPLNMKNVESITRDINLMEWSHPSPLRWVQHHHAHLLFSGHKLIIGTDQNLH